MHSSAASRTLQPSAGLKRKLRVGYETYTADGHYANLAAAFLAVAVSNGLNRPFTEPSGGREASLLLEHDPTCRAVLHNGIYSLHFNGRPAPDYDTFGVVDLTFGPGRFLQFVSSAKHLESGLFLNLGMASSSGSSQDDLALIGRMEGGLTPPRLQLEARNRGSPYRYRFAARVQTEGVYIEEAAPGLEEPKVLLILGSHLASMKRNATLINTSRGAVVREAEMVEVLEERPDLWAVLDVTHPEPPESGSRLYDLPNVVLTPHIAGSQGNECRRMGRLVVDELRRYVAGEPLQHEITRERAALMA